MLLPNYEFWAKVYLAHGESEVRKGLIEKGYSLLNANFLERWANPNVPLHPQNESDLEKLFSHKPFKTLPTGVFRSYLALVRESDLTKIWLYKPFDYDQIGSIKTIQDIAQNPPDPRRFVLSSDEYFELLKTCKNSENAQILEKYKPKEFCLHYYGYENQTSYLLGVPINTLVRNPNFDPRIERPATPLGLAYKSKKT